MRSFTTAVQNLLANNLGLEPVNILEVQWGDLSGQWSKYADKDISGYEFPIAGQILQISDLESVVKLDTQGQSQSLSVTLSDSTGQIKSIFNTNDLHGKQCKFYQWFEGLPLSERFKLYEGEISSPITWSEGDRTLSFDIITKLADKEVGFSPEEGYFEFLPEDAYGKVWPLAFGKVQNVPATRLSEIPNTLTAEPLGVADPTIWERRAELGQKLELLRGLFFFYTMAAGQAAFTCDWGDTPEQRQNACSAQQQFENMTGQISAQIAQVEAESSDLWQTLLDQEANQNSTLEVLDGGNFPSGNVILQSGDVRMQGTFSGNVFNIQSLDLLEYTGYNKEPFGFTWQREGTTITIQSDTPIIYICNLLPSTILYVAAYKQVENGKVLTVVPNAWYTIKTANMGPYTVTYLTFSKPVSSFDDAYEDEIYITMESSIGPNTVDILTWFIQTYTDMAIDSTSFNHVRTLVDNYPSHFALLERKNILLVLEEIAFQARCAIWINDRTFYIKYLPEELAATSTIDESQIDAGSLTIRTSTTEEIVTKLVATWRADYSFDENNQIILRHNVKKYGAREREFNFYIYNIFDLVLKSATFWLIRYANAWKYIDFIIYLDNLAIETFDTVKFDFTEDFVASSAVKGIIMSAVYNSGEKTVKMSAWLPVKCGTMVRYDFAEPHDISIDLVFPTKDEVDNGYAGGDGIGVDVEGGLEFSDLFKGSVGYTSSSSLSESGQRIQGRDYGDQYPSDLDDTKPEPSFVGRSVGYASEPQYEYIYPDYEFDTPSIESDTEFSFSFPGKVLAHLGGGIYTVNVYKFGLQNDPETIQVEQLQIDTDEEIPADTWVLVAYNRWVEGSGDDQEIKSEFTMQVPVWL